MRVIIIGCGRVGARTAAELDQRGDHVTVIDVEQRAFGRLPSTFGGVTVRGSGSDEDILRGAGADLADLLMALTEGDNRNAMAAQVGKHIFGIPRVIAKINDPLRAEAYRTLGLETIDGRCPRRATGVAATKGAEATNGAASATDEPRQGIPGRFRAAAKAQSASEEAAPRAPRPPGKPRHRRRRRRRRAS